jgi:hypothetical protein
MGPEKLLKEETMAEKAEKTADTKAAVEEQAYRNTGLASQCPAVGTNETAWLVRRRRIRYQRRQTYHYHHAP